jgi:rhodanese-related sulfurtransferase
MSDSEFKEIDVEQVPEGAFLLDVREPDEWAAGHVEGAVHIPMGQVEGRLAELPKEGEVIVVCRIGGRSAKVAGMLAQHGFDAVNMNGGMLAWDAAGKPMVSEGDAKPYVLV